MADESLLSEFDEDELEELDQSGASGSGVKRKADGSTVGGSSGDGGPRKHYFTKELRCMVYGFGDDKVPYTETVELLEEIVVEFIKEMTLKALEVGKTGRVTLEDIWYWIRRDPKKYARVKDLLTMGEELKKARKAFDEANY